MAEQKQPETSEEVEEKMNPEDPTVYDIWKPADGLFKADSTDKKITFVSSREGRSGFVRVVGKEEGYASTEPKTFNVPAGYKCEVLGCRIKFTRA